MNKICTDVNQSKKLAEFLPIESADMKWFTPADNESEFIEEVSLINNKSEYTLFDNVSDCNDTPYIPAWSLAALLEIIPWGQVNRMTNSNKWEASSWTNSNFVSEFYVEGYDNPIDACYEMILTLKEKGLL